MTQDQQQQFGKVWHFYKKKKKNKRQWQVKDNLLSGPILHLLLKLHLKITFNKLYAFLYLVFFIITTTL